MNITTVAILIAGLLSGIFFGSFIDLGWSFVILIILLSLAVYISTWMSNVQVVGSLNKYLVSIFLLSFALGMARFNMVNTKSDLVNLASLEGAALQVTGTIIDEPREKDRTTILVVRTSLDGRRFFNAQVITGPYTKFSYGDRIKIYGTLEKVENFSSDFDYEAYLAKDEIYYRFLNPKISIESHDNASWIQAKLFNFKNSFMANINTVIPEPESSLMGGIILGAKSSLDKKLTEDFKRVSLIHIVALSGYNVSVIADYMMKIFWFLPLMARLSIGSVLIILFAAMTGGGPTVIRASVMILLAMLARATGRIYEAGLALLVAAAGMILYDPKIFVFDISFQLSFLATAGLILFTPILEKYLSVVPNKFKIREALVSTIAAQLAVWPLILYKMGTFSTVSLVVNVLVGPLIPYAMLAGFLTGFLGYINYFLSLAVGGIAHVLLLYIVKVAELFSGLPFASIMIPGFPLLFVAATYLTYLFFIVAFLCIKW